jgi:hypothetical protein
MSGSNQWTNQMEILSEASNRIYTIAQHPTNRRWACTCPGWRAHRHCKHLERLGLVSGEESFEVEEARAKNQGFLVGYPTYDTSAGHGSPAEWLRMLQECLGLVVTHGAPVLFTDTGCDEVRQALHRASTENMLRLAIAYEEAMRAFDDLGPAER